MQDPGDHYVSALRNTYDFLKFKQRNLTGVQSRDSFHSDCTVDPQQDGHCEDDFAELTAELKIRR